MIKRHILMLLLCFCSSLAVNAEEDFESSGSDNSEIIIKGESRDRRVHDRGGSSVTIRPNEETRFDSAAHFKLEPSLLSVDQVRSTTGGFSLPLFRGHDIRSSSVFLDGVALQDPLTGFPLVEDVDLRSFGEMRIHKGLAPWDVAVAAPGGVVQFFTKPVASSLQQSVGTTLGDVHGLSAWGQVETKEEQRSLRGYARRHTGRGDYKFYSDHQTIRNPDDDEIVRKTNNESNATLFVVHGAYKSDSSSSTWLGWNQDSERGMPGRGFLEGNAGRIFSRSTVASVSYAREIAAGTSLGATAQGLFNRRRARDPSQWMGMGPTQRFDSNTMQLAANFRRIADPLSSFAECRQSRVALKTAMGGDGSLKEDHSWASTCYLGLEWKLLSTLTLEFKADRVIVSREAQPSGNMGVTAMLDQQSYRVWSQFALHERRPSLLEFYGNGAEILGNEDLRPEDGQYAELGVRFPSRWQSWTGLRSVSVWGDRIQGRIHIDPASASRWKAQNVGQETYRGVEWREHWSTGRWDLEAAASMLRAQQENGKLLPRIPIWQTVGAVGFKLLPDWQLRSINRYSGRVFDDYDNTSEISDFSVHDLTLDRFNPQSPWALGISVLNLTDLKSLAVRDVETGQSDGRIAYESQMREPLPGRQWVVSLRTSF